jgi:hypothetical protein
MMSLSSRNILFTILACGSVAAIIVACGSEGSKFDDGRPPTGLFSDGSFDPDSRGGPDLYANDPPPPWCGPPGEEPPPIGGTEECPDDKNKPGCGCKTVGEEAPCWTGLRRHRNLGRCKDGRTKCIAKSETQNVWGDCVGEVLPDPNGKGADACRCFSVGIWNIENTSPCLRQQSGTYWAHSTVQSGNTVGGCDVSSPVAPGTAPAGIWSKNSLIVDCAGAYKLCFRIRAGVYENPSPTDCILGEVCTNVDYKEANVEQPLPDLPTWAGKDNACAKKWEFDTPEDKSPGYGEMIVYGKTVRCDEIAENGQEYVFHRVKYCPRICRPSHPNYNPSHPECADCQLKGSGKFE